MLACAAAHAAPAPQVSVSITTAHQAALGVAGAVAAEVTVDRKATLPVEASAGGQSLGPAQQVVFKQRGTQAVSLPLSAEGRAIAARCGALTVKMTAGTAAASKELAPHPRGRFPVGGAPRPINPGPNGPL